MGLFSTLKKYSQHSATRSVGIYTVSNFLTKSVSFLLVFIFTNPKYITPSENGLLSIFNNFVLFLKPIMMLGVIHSVGVDFFKMDKSRFRDSFTTGFFLSALVGFISLLIFFLFRDYLHLQYGFSNIIVIAIPLVTFFFLCLEQLQNILRSEQRPDLFMRTSMTRLFLEFGTSVLLVVFFSWHWYGRIAGLIISQGTLTVFGVIYFLRRGYLKGTIKREFIKTEMKYALPVIALQMAFFAVNSSDKFYLSHFSNDNNVSLGIYSFASIFASVVFTLHQALIQYFFPKIYSTLAQDTVDYVLIRKNFLIYTAIMAAGTLMLILGAPLAYHLLINKAYLPALDYFYLFCIGYFLWSISYFFFSFLLFHKNKRKILFLSLASIGISLALNYYGISRWASFGGAAAVALSCLIILLLTLLFNIKEVKLVFRSR